MSGAPLVQENILRCEGFRFKKNLNCVRISTFQGILACGQAGLWRSGRAASRVSRRRWVRLLLQIWSCAGPRFVQRCISGVTTCLGRVRRRPTLQMRGYAPFDVADMELSAPGAANMELPASAGALYSISAALVALNSISAALVIYNSKYAAGNMPSIRRGAGCARARRRARPVQTSEPNAAASQFIHPSTV